MWIEKLCLLRLYLQELVKYGQNVAKLFWGKIRLNFIFIVLCWRVIGMCINLMENKLLFFCSGHYLFLYRLDNACILNCTFNAMQMTYYYCHTAQLYPYIMPYDSHKDTNQTTQKMSTSPGHFPTPWTLHCRNYRPPFLHLHIAPTPSSTIQRSAHRPFHYHDKYCTYWGHKERMKKGQSGWMTHSDPTGSVKKLKFLFKMSFSVQI